MWGKALSIFQSELSLHWWHLTILVILLSRQSDSLHFLHFISVLCKCAFCIVAVTFQTHHLSISKFYMIDTWLNVVVVKQHPDRWGSLKEIKIVIKLKGVISFSTFRLGTRHKKSFCFWITVYIVQSSQIKYCCYPLVDVDKYLCLCYF